MNKKRYNENDEIELRLEHHVGFYYHLQWRFKEPRKFLCFNIRDKWKNIFYYKGTNWVYNDPNDDHYWRYASFSLGSQNEAGEYERLKDKVKTKKDLFEYYSIKERTNKYFNDLHEHKKWEDETNKRIKKYA